MPDITDLIESDHREVEGLFAQFKQSPGKDLALSICTELDAHAQGEERVFYPAVREQVPDGSRLVDEGEKEHSEAKQLIGRIKNTEDVDHLTELVTELEAAVSHHVSEEESAMLPKSRDAMDEAVRSELAAEFQSVKAGA